MLYLGEENFIEMFNGAHLMDLGHVVLCYGMTAQRRAYPWTISAWESLISDYDPFTLPFMQRSKYLDLVKVAPNPNAITPPTLSSLPPYGATTFSPAIHMSYLLALPTCLRKQ